MNTREIRELFEKIKMYYNVFTFNDEKIKEWYRILKDYDANDVEKKLIRIRSRKSRPTAYYVFINKRSN